MLHLMKYRLLSLIREKSIVAWSILFPLILGTLFYVSFGNINNGIKAIPAAVVVNDDSVHSVEFQNVLKSVSKEKDDILSVEYLEEDEALAKLKEKEIYGIFYAEDKPSLTVAGKGMEESVLRSVLDSFNSQAAVYTDIAEEYPDKLAQVSKEKYIEAVKEVTITGREVDGIVQYFYSLIAMACMFSCFIGFQISIQLQANIEDVAVRRNITPVNKLKQLISDIIVGYGIQLVSMTILMVLLRFGFGIDFGDNIPKLIWIIMAGSLIGISIGMAIGSIGKMGENVKIGILVGVSLVTSFLAGLMVNNIKGVIEKNIPILNKINPAALITDAIYCVSVYDDPERYRMDIIILVVMAVVISTIAFMMTRRKRYDSI